MRKALGPTLCFLVTVAVAGSAAEPESTGTIPERPAGPHWPVKAEAHAGAVSFVKGAPVVGTTYFYWYDNETGFHVIDADGTDALTTHPADMDDLSYKHASWHESQLRDMTAAGIDFLMPVYWGVPGANEGEGYRWSFAGLPPLVAAHERLIEQGANPPPIGMFFDTSILQFNGFNADGSAYHVDLTTDFGKAWFYAVLRDFFSLIPPSKWARVDGKPIVFLYAASFAKAQDPELFPYVRRRFQKDFGCDLFLVKMRDWQGEADAAYQWTGGSGFQIDPDVIAIAPGYDHSAVPGRDRLVTDRRDGLTYSERWFQALRLNPARRPWMVHIETWNEWHEGTDIADSREHGRTYIALTRVFADLWRNGHIELRGPYTDTDMVSWAPGHAQGLTISVSEGDGRWEAAVIDGETAVVSAANEGSGGRYLYFDVDESFAFDLDGRAMSVTVTYRDAGCDGFRIDYDNIDPDAGPVDGAFRPGDSVLLSGTDTWKTSTFRLAGCRFINRCNGGDFRLGVLGGDKELAVRRVVITKAGTNH